MLFPLWIKASKSTAPYSVSALMVAQYKQTVSCSHIASKSTLIQTVSRNSRDLQRTLRLAG